MRACRPSPVHLRSLLAPATCAALVLSASPSAGATGNTTTSRPVISLTGPLATPRGSAQGSTKQRNLLPSTTGAATGAGGVNAQATGSAATQGIPSTSTRAAGAATNTTSTTVYAPPTTTPAGAGATGVGATGVGATGVGATGATAVAPASVPLTSATSARTGAARASSGGGKRISTGAALSAVLAALLALGAAAWALARSRAYEPSWVQSLGHSLAEARFRVSATLAELSDWARLGR